MKVEQIKTGRSLKNLVNVLLCGRKLERECIDRSVGNNAFLIFVLAISKTYCCCVDVSSTFCITPYIPYVLARTSAFFTKYEAYKHLMQNRLFI